MALQASGAGLIAIPSFECGLGPTPSHEGLTVDGFTGKRTGSLPNLVGLRGWGPGKSHGAVDGTGYRAGLSASSQAGCQAGGAWQTSTGLHGKSVDGFTGKRTGVIAIPSWIAGFRPGKPHRVHGSEGRDGQATVARCWAGHALDASKKLSAASDHRRSVLG